MTKRIDFATGKDQVRAPQGSRLNVLYEWGLTFLFVGVLGVMAWLNYLERSREEQERTAATYIWLPERHFEQQAYQEALHGSESGPGFLELARMYKGGKIGRLATFYAALCYMHEQEYAQALEHFEPLRFEGEEAFMQARVWAAMGYAYLALGEQEKAIAYYERAVGHTASAYAAPLYLVRLAHIYEEQGAYAQAIDCYKRIVKIAKGHPQGHSAEKHIGRLKVKLEAQREQA